MPELKIFKMHENVKTPSLATTESACFDLRCFFQHVESVVCYTEANEKITLEVKGDSTLPIPPKSRVLIPSGMIIHIPSGYSIRLHPRSGLSLKYGLTLINAEGIIDSDYTEELFIPIYNTSNKTVIVSEGERVAQAETMESMRYIEFWEIKERPTQKTDRTGGFGSTGIS